MRLPRVSHLVCSPYGIVSVPFEAVLFPFDPHSQTDTRLLDPPILPSDQYSIRSNSIILFCKYCQRALSLSADAILGCAEKDHGSVSVW